jgi:RNA polymerase sigma-70 factor (ECF subfamily)
MNEAAEKLCDRAKAGDVAAASELVVLFHKPVFAFFRRLCRSHEDAEDLTQKTFSKVWSSLASYRGRSSVSTWIHGIGYHVYVDWRRKKNPLEAKTDEWWEACVGEGPSPFEDAAEREVATQLYALVEQLEQGSREVVHLHYYQGLSIQETADVLDVATSTVKYRLRGALSYLRSKSAEPKMRTT